MPKSVLKTTKYPHNLHAEFRIGRVRFVPRFYRRADRPLGHAARLVGWRRRLVVIDVFPVDHDYDGRRYGYLLERPDDLVVPRVSHFRAVYLRDERIDCWREISTDSMF